jgi:DNA repair protein RecO (recombination protein O)
MSTLIRSEAIVLQGIVFKEYDRILTLFAPHGLFKLFAKGTKRDYFHFAALTTPLTLAEFHYTQGRKDLHRLYEGSVLNQNIHLRERYETLMAAERLVAALLHSQWIGKPAPKLYHLFSLFIGHLSAVKDPYLLVTAFLLKILAHEGVLHLDTPCSTHRYGGERYPSSEAPPGALFFSQEEETLLTQLTLCRSLAQFSYYQQNKEFQTKIELLFEQTFATTI